MEKRTTRSIIKYRQQKREKVKITNLRPRYQECLMINIEKRKISKKTENGPFNGF